MNPTLTSTLQGDIAHALRTSGRYVGELDSASTQHRVDAQWAAHLAGREVGVRVSVKVHEERPDKGSPRAMLHVSTRP